MALKTDRREWAGSQSSGSAWLWVRAEKWQRSICRVDKEAGDTSPACSGNQAARAPLWSKCCSADSALQRRNAKSTSRHPLNHFVQGKMNFRSDNESLSKLCLFSAVALNLSGAIKPIKRFLAAWDDKKNWCSGSGWDLLSLRTSRRLQSN